MLSLTPGVQSPKAYDLANLTAAQLGTRLAAGAGATLRANFRTVLSDAGNRYLISAAETTAGLVDADLHFGFDLGDAGRYKTVGDGVTDNLAAINKALANTDARGPLKLQPGDYLTSAVPTNTYGVPIDGPGRILKAITGGNQQLNSFADRHQHVFGREYMAAFHNRILGGFFCNIVLTGDSTTAGTSITNAEFLPNAILSTLALDAGITNQTFYKNGHGGATSSDWLASYVTGDITNGGATPSLFIVRWGINDPDFGISLATYAANMRAALAQIRASLTVAQASILLMAPNSTSDTPNGRDEKWYEQVSPLLRQLAREYQCTFLDTYALTKDSRGAANIWMDDPYADGRSIHPLECLNALIYTEVARIMYPPGLSPVRANHLINYSSNDKDLSAAAIVIAPSATPSTYRKGITIHRATQPGGGANWPRDGAALTVRQTDGQYAVQFNWSASDGLSECDVRIGQANAWLPWFTLKDATPTVSNLSLLNSWVAYAAGYTARATKAAGRVSLHGLIKSGTTTTGTVLAVLPAGYRPSEKCWFSCTTDTANQTATVYVDTDGSVILFATPSSGFVSLDPINFAL